jgi:hypothetical protein
MLRDEPQDILLDADHKVIIDGDLRWSSGPAGIAQGIKIACLMVKGEWFLDLEEGPPYLENAVVPANEALLGGRFNKVKALAEYRRAILSAPGTNEIVSLEISFDPITRRMQVDFEVKTAFGDTIADSVITAIGA